MTFKEQDSINESILTIKNRIDKYTGRERHVFLIACRANIRLARLVKSKRQFALLPEYEEYSQFVDAELAKCAPPQSLAVTGVAVPASMLRVE
jgi:hypothetical protein